MSQKPINLKGSLIRVILLNTQILGMEDFVNKDINITKGHHEISCYFSVSKPTKHNKATRNNVGDDPRP